MEIPPSLPGLLGFRPGPVPFCLLRISVLLRDSLLFRLTDEFLSGSIGHILPSCLPFPLVGVCVF